MRSVYFVTVSAEESGLLGSAHFAANPPIPLRDIVANVNVDSGNLYGETDDIVGIGAERSDLFGYLQEAARAEGLTVSMDAAPNQGSFFRSDQLAFARGGVPAVFVNTGRSYRGRPADYDAQVRDAYRGQRYHQPSDELTDDLVFGGILQQTRVAFRLGYGLANSTLRPMWKPSEAFAETRRHSEQGTDAQASGVTACGPSRRSSPSAADGPPSLLHSWRLWRRCHARISPHPPPSSFGLLGRDARGRPFLPAMPPLEMTPLAMRTSASEIPIRGRMLTGRGQPRRRVRDRCDRRGDVFPTHRGHAREARKEMDEDTDDGGLGDAIKDVVGGVVNKALATTVQIPLKQVEDIRYERGRLFLDTADDWARTSRSTTMATQTTASSSTRTLRSG